MRASFMRLKVLRGPSFIIKLISLDRRLVKGLEIFAKSLINLL